MDAMCLIFGFLKIYHTLNVQARSYQTKQDFK